MVSDRWWEFKEKVRMFLCKICGHNHGCCSKFYKSCKRCCKNRCEE